MRLNQRLVVVTYSICNFTTLIICHFSLDAFHSGIASFRKSMVLRSHEELDNGHEVVATSDRVTIIIIIYGICMYYWTVVANKVNIFSFQCRPYIKKKCVFWSVLQVSQLLFAL